MPVDPVRDAAVDVLLRLERKDMRLDESLEKTLRRKGHTLSARGRRFLSQLVYGTVRHQGLCDRVYEPFLEQPPNKLPDEIRVILRMGVFQSLFCNQVTFPAMVHTSVDLAKKRAHAGLAKVTNAVLRKVPQSLDDITFPDPQSDLASYMMVRYSLPQWLTHKWIFDLGPETALQVAEASAEQAPLAARVNSAKTTVHDLMTTLAKQGVAVTPHSIIPDAITLEGASGIIDSKAFQQGLFILQDLASMLPVHLLGPKRFERIADLCSAPGGKTTHIAQFQERPPLTVRQAEADPCTETSRYLEMMNGISRAGSDFERDKIPSRLGYRSIPAEPQVLWDKLGIESIDLAAITVPREAIDSMDEGMARAYAICPAGFDGDILKIATSNPTNAVVLENLRNVLQRPIMPVFAPLESIAAGLDRFYPPSGNQKSKPLEFDDWPLVYSVLPPRAAHVYAIDLDRWRLERVLENVERLGLSGIHVAAADANHPPFRSESFDRVLLDAPCSGLGTLRRHPEIKWRLRPRSIRRLGDQQRDLLRSAIDLCKNGGVVVYSVCTFTPEETREVVEPFIQEGIVSPEDGPEWLNQWRISQGMYRTLPGPDPLDGFFLTRLRKRS